MIDGKKSQKIVNKFKLPGTIKKFDGIRIKSTKIFRCKF